MSNFFARQGAGYANEMKRSLGALVGIAQGMLCDNQLSDDEVRFLDRWLNENSAIANEWPGDVIHARVKGALADGVITDAERAHLVSTLTDLIGGSGEQAARREKVTTLAGRIRRAADRFRVQPSMFDGIEAIDEEFMPAPGRPRPANNPRRYVGKSWDLWPSNAWAETN